MAFRRSRQRCLSLWLLNGTEFLEYPSDVVSVGRIPEARRWKNGAVPARRQAFESAGFGVDSRSGDVLRDSFDRPMSC